MEYPTNDFYLKFKTLYNEDGNFIDYELIFISDDFYNATKIDPLKFLGRRFSEIVVDNADKLCFKEVYINLIPNLRLRYNVFISELKRYYLINIFCEESGTDNFVYIYYIDITDIKGNSQKDNSESNYTERNNIIYLKNKVKMYYKDKLTDLYNKSFFEEELSRLDTKRQLPISLIFGDINGLKLINDAFGHEMGDNTLKKVAELMKSSFRDEDIISRVGGDEFIVLLPKTTEETAKEIVRRIKQKCENNPLDFIKISISFGIATKTDEEDIHKVLKKAEDRMYFKKLNESKAAKRTMIEYLKNSLEKITYETNSHYARLKQLTLMMAEALGLSEKEKDELRMLCEFHDIGKIGVSKNILQKESSLDHEEWENVKRHSEIGYYIAREFRDKSPIDELILIHHERWDGKGYPGLFKKEEIPLIARIFAVADAYDVMVNYRPYKSPMSEKEALEEIKAQSGKQFDPHIADLFVNLMEKNVKVV